MTEADVIVTKEDLQELGYCFKASRPWLRARGIEWGDFIENGVTVGKLREIGDGLSDRVIEHRLAKEAANG